MQYRYILGIDPGNAGAIVVRDTKFDIYRAHKMPETPKDIFDQIQHYADSLTIDEHMFACLEQVHGRPGMAATAMFTFGRNYGSLLVSLHANSVAFETWTPQKWQKEFQLGSSKGIAYADWKRKLKEKAQQLFPKENITLWNADAYLLNEYLRRHLNKTAQ